ncbi:MAG: hypothetical protein DHS20C17_35160 [Cyclobacteriaceae bacterium]|nr:MAG: hypothetical protein DHS20C17_35160 [Cyclobacteriaceae bacterium]
MAILAMFSLPMISQNSITDTELDDLSRYLKDSKKDLLNTLKALSDHQINYKPDDESWSIAEVVEHIALSESFIFSLAQGALESPTPDLTKNLTDEQITSIITSRETKVKTRPELEPKAYKGSYQEALNDFKQQRKKHIKFLESTDADLRHHYFEFPFGTADTYQVMLFMAGHAVRHTKQIQEIKSSLGFPGV